LSEGTPPHASFENVAIRARPLEILGVSRFPFLLTHMLCTWQASGGFPSMDTKRGFRSGVCHAGNVERTSAVAGKRDTMQEWCKASTESIGTPRGEGRREHGRDAHKRVLEFKAQHAGHEAAEDRVVTLLDEELSDAIARSQQTCSGSDDRLEASGIGPLARQSNDNDVVVVVKHVHDAELCNFGRLAPRVRVSDAGSAGTVLWGFRVQQLYPYVYQNEIETLHVGCRHTICGGAQVNFYLMSVEQPGERHALHLPESGDTIDVSHVARRWKGFFILAEIMCAASFHSLESATLFGDHCFENEDEDDDCAPAAAAADMVVKIGLLQQAWAKHPTLKASRLVKATVATSGRRRNAKNSVKCGDDDWQRLVQDALSQLRASQGTSVASPAHLS
jgi:hypothetical protein